MRSDLKVEYSEDKPKSGMWHCGPNPFWIKLTHEPTGMSVRIYSGNMSQHKTREYAYDLMDMMLGDFGEELARFMERET